MKKRQKERAASEEGYGRLEGEHDGADVKDSASQNAGEVDSHQRDHAVESSDPESEDSEDSIGSASDLQRRSTGFMSRRKRESCKRTYRQAS